jgi:hypothetical protein
VKRGDVLLQVMDDKSDWHLELEIAEHRVGRILKAQRHASASTAASDRPVAGLPVKYQLLTQPEAAYFGVLDSLATRTVLAESDGSILEGRASLDKAKLPKCTIGAEVRARIDCGQSNMGDVLFGDIVDFALKYLWW